MTQLANAEDLTRLHDILYDNFQRYGRDIGCTPWGWPGESAELEATYLFTVGQSVLLLGPPDLDNRWWWGANLEDDFPRGSLAPIFEFNIPKAPNRALARYEAIRRQL